MVAPVGGYPWTGMQLRSLPLLIEREGVMTLVETRRGIFSNTRQSDPHSVLRGGWLSARPGYIPGNADDGYTPVLE